MAMRHRAWLAWRLPPWLRRWRVVLPEEASTGEAPHSAAKEASLWSRCGLSPAVMSRIEAVSVPMPLAAAQSRVGCGGELIEVPAQLGEVFVEGAVLARQGAQGGLGGLCGLGDVAGTEPGASPHALGGGERLQVAAQLVVGGGDEVADLVGDAGAMGSGRAQRDPQNPYRLDYPVVALGHRGGVAAERGAGGGLGVDGVGLAAPRRRTWRFGRITSTTSMPAPTRWRARPTP